MADIDELMANFFGPQPDGMFLAIGRLTALTSLQDLWVRNLLATMVDEPMAPYEALSFFKLGREIEMRLHVVPEELQTEAKNLLDQLKRSRGDRNASVHTVWSRYGFGWRNAPRVKDADPRKVLTVRTDQATMEAKVLEAARLVERLMDLQGRCQQLQVDRHYANAFVALSTKQSGDR